MSSSPIPVWLLTEKGVAFADIPTYPKGRMVDFCIIGSAKCGTTSLDEDLSHHPRVFCCRPKEPHYFSSEILLKRGEEWYTGLYAEAGVDQICGEASTSYTRWPLVAGTAERMFRANPRMKLIYIVRNPVDRVQSELLQTVKYLKNVVGVDLRHLPLDDVFEKMENPASPYYSAIAETSKYENQIVEFERFFPKNQILILTQGEFRKKPEETMRRVQNFLGIGPNPRPLETVPRNVTSDFFKKTAHEQTADRLRDHPLYPLAHKILPRSLKSKILSNLARPADPATRHLSKDLRRQLEAEFESYNKIFERRIGLPWAEW
ncbi:Sulfotransferase domain-containing protein [Paracoccus sediminis]|uniref:Sulfotransferase domain-containing protein n=2 Tax=Paracoccus sediminis TaxID=1214787 RepID=A0A238Y7X0_9RHOB|nr:Sulfotransferase domain-containing protein [Paracoccus sediminis]